MGTGVSARPITRIRVVATLVPVVIIAAGVFVVLAFVRSPGGRSLPGDPLNIRGATRSAVAFLDRYESSSGRVVRLDQGSDTVSEGQAYAMLISASIGERADFTRAWQWTQAHLQERDGLLAYHWQGGRVTGSEPASDADLDAAHALVLAAQKFHEPTLLRAGGRIGRAVLSHETAQTAIGPVLTAGPWAVSSRTIDPSYFSPTGFQALYRASGNPTWQRLEQTSYAIINRLTSASGLQLPPDWATLDSAGHATTASAPSGESPRYSYDALRVPVRMAGSHTSYGVGMAARLWHFFAPGHPAPSGAAYTLGGRVMTSGQNPAMLAGAAAAAFAAGQRNAARSLLSRALSLTRSTPTYYGMAILALTQLDLDNSPGKGPM